MCRHISHLWQLAPELEAIRRLSTLKSDVWSFGLIIASCVWLTDEERADTVAAYPQLDAALQVALVGDHHQRATSQELGVLLRAFR